MERMKLMVGSRGNAKGITAFIHIAKLAGMTEQEIVELISSVWRESKEVDMKKEVAEVRHGRWERKEDECCYWFECSECGEEPAKTNDNDDYFSAYCPHCGAKMDAE